MVEIVVHLPLMSIFFVPKLYVGGNGSDFSSTLESYIWDYMLVIETSVNSWLTVARNKDCTRSSSI